MSMIFPGQYVGQREDGQHYVHFEFLSFYYDMPDLVYQGPGVPEGKYYKIANVSSKLCYPATEEEYIAQQKTIHGEEEIAQRSKDEYYTRAMILERMGQMSDLNREIRLLIDKLPLEDRTKLSPLSYKTSLSLNDLVTALSEK